MYHINGYLISKKIGRGSFGKIYQCFKDNKQYAVKIINVDKKYGIVNFLELSIMNSFNHKNINNCIDIYLEDYKLYIFQNIALGDLYDLRSKKLSKKKIKYILFNVVRGVKLLHSYNIVHCDIKSNNILYFEDGSIKLTDFGESTLLPTKETKCKHETSTPSYKSPEIINSKPWDKSLDIWCLGCLFYEIYTGKSLFKFQGKNLSLYKLAHDDFFKFKKDFNYIPYKLEDYKPPNISRNHIRHIDDDFLVLVFSMLSENPEDRPTCSQILKSNYFKKMKQGTYKVIKPVYNITKIDILIDNLYIHNLIEKLYSCSLNIRHYSKDEILISCKSIIMKYITGDRESENIELEHIICKNINYRLILL